MEEVGGVEELPWARLIEVDLTGGEEIDEGVSLTGDAKTT